MRTSRSPAASRAWSSAASMPSLTKRKVVPPGRSQGSRFSCVTTKTGVWNGASGGHDGSPRSNMRLPITLAPVRWNVSPQDVVVAPFLAALAELQVLPEEPLGEYPLLQFGPHSDGIQSPRQLSAGSEPPGSFRRGLHQQGTVGILHRPTGHRQGE